MSALQVIIIYYSYYYCIWIKTNYYSKVMKWFILYTQRNRTVKGFFYVMRKVGILITMVDWLAVDWWTVDCWYFRLEKRTFTSSSLLNQRWAIHLGTFLCGTHSVCSSSLANVTQILSPMKTLQRDAVVRPKTRSPFTVGVKARRASRPATVVKLTSSWIISNG